MYTLAPDEKTTTTMVYTQNMFVRGEVVSKQNIRISIWLRSQGSPEYLRLLKPQILFTGGNTVKPVTLSEIFLPKARVIAFHIAPPASDPVDYEADEKDRVMEPVSLLVGTFLFAGKLRISSQTGLATSIEMAHVSWMSVYDVDISNPYLPQMAIHVPMLLVNPSQVSYGIV